MAQPKGWKRDLLRECVEPNPGPSWEEILKDLVDKKLGGPEKAEQYSEQLNELGNFVAEVCGLPNDKKIREKFLGSQKCAEFANRGDDEETIIGFLGEIVALPGNAQVTPDMVLDQILHQLSEHLRCVLDIVEDVNVATTLSFTGRQQQQVNLGKIEGNNITAFLAGSRVKQSYQCGLVHGSLGVGKSRLVAEFNRSLQFRNGSKFRCGFITLDCSAGDSDTIAFTSADNILAVSVLAHFFFGKSARWLRGLVGSSASINTLTLNSVMKYISVKYHTATTPILLAIQVDEFSELDPNVLNSFLKNFTSHMIEDHALQICLLPTLSGTTTKAGIKAITGSQMTVSEILVPPLTEEETQQVIEKAWENDPKDTPVSRLLPPIIAALGNIPRNIAIFLDTVEKEERQSNIRRWLSDTFIKVTERIQQMYGTKAWDRFLGQSRVAVTRMCVWILAGKEVQLNDKLNGVSVEDIRSTGIVQVQQVSETDDVYTMHIPLATLAALNNSLRFVSPHTLNPAEMVDFFQFERTMGSLFILRNNMLVSLKQMSATYRELFPYALGRAETLDRRVSIKSLESYQALGNSATHDSLHKMPMRKISVGQDSATSFIDATQGESYVFNVDKAPSMDALVVHPPLRELRDLSVGGELYQIQADQFKSSQHITNGQPPTSQLQIGTAKAKKTIKHEYAKVNNASHQKFYTNGTGGKYQLTFAVISNKPLSNSCKSPEDLPENVLVICNQNFKQYSSVFCHRGIYIQYDPSAALEDEGKENTEVEDVEDVEDVEEVEEMED